MKIVNMGERIFTCFLYMFLQTAQGSEMYLNKHECEVYFHCNVVGHTGSSMSLSSDGVHRNQQATFQ